MNKKHIIILALSFMLAVLSAVPALAGTWVDEGDSVWTYLNDDGESIQGWIDDGDHKYYLDEDGCRKTGWYKTKGDWYYFEEDGVLASDTWVDNYYVNAEGIWVKTR